MGGLLLIGLLIILMVKLWPFLVAGVVVWGLWRFGIAPVREACVRERGEQLRHAQARRDINRMAAETRRAMHAAAARDGTAVEDTSVEVRRG
jgi:hypothetical protein